LAFKRSTKGRINIGELAKAMVGFLLDFLCIAFDDDVELVGVVVFFNNEGTVREDFITEMVFGKFDKVVEVGGFIEFVTKEFGLFKKKREKVETLRILKVFWMADKTEDIIEKEFRSISRVCFHHKDH